MINDIMKQLPEFLATTTEKELTYFIGNLCEEASEDVLLELTRLAMESRRVSYGNKVFFRGLIEFSSYCKNDCYYCGLQKSNLKAVRYRLTDSQILHCCELGYERGFRTFVLQSGEDQYYTDYRLCSITSNIKDRFSDCAVTLSIGERSRESYQALFDAGADRYLLRHETANETHYAKLHPARQTLKSRMRCLYYLKEIGFQVGAGFMVDSPFQTYETLADDIIFLRDFKPHMIGIGPFIPHKDTGFAHLSSPDIKNTLIMLSLVRCLLPKALLPATTALATADIKGRERGLFAGANVIMPNLTPVDHRKDYSLYDNKLSIGCEAMEGFSVLLQQLKALGFEPDFSRGDHLDFNKDEER